MKPFLLDDAQIAAYLAAGHWTRETIAERYAAYARDFPDKLACRDAHESLTWRELDALTDRVAANLIARGIERDARALVRMPSSNLEMVLRVALRKAGVIGCFAPMQWRHRELEHACGKLEPAVVFATSGDERAAWAEGTSASLGEPPLRVCLAGDAPQGWAAWRDLTREPSCAPTPARAFRFDEVSLLTVSSGSSGLPKLCEWPEAAQTCVGRAIAGRLRLGPEDNIGIFAPMAGGPGLFGWLTSSAVPYASIFPAHYDAHSLLALIEEEKITVATTVPVVLARLAQEDLAAFDLRSLRALRVGSAATDADAARRLESLTNCRVIPAAGSMECPGFAHADVGEPAALRLNGTSGLPHPGCRLRIEDDAGGALPPGEAGHLKVSAPYASTGYWRDPAATRAAWSGGWNVTGDVALIEEGGRLRLLGRNKEVINRSGHKILPGEVECEIARHPDVFACAVVAAPDPEYGEAPWAFVQPRAGKEVDAPALARALRASGLATYKMPARFIAVSEFPRVGGNEKIDKKRLLQMAAAQREPGAHEAARDEREEKP